MALNVQNERGTLTTYPWTILELAKIDQEHFIFRGFMRTGYSDYQNAEVKMSVHSKYPLAPDLEANEGQIVIQLCSSTWLLFETYWTGIIDPLGLVPIGTTSLSVMDLYSKLRMFGFNRNNNSVIMMTLNGLFTKL